MDFTLASSYSPTGDQPQAIQQLVDGIRHGDRAQVLLGVTGSGKTFTIANVIAQVRRPTLVISHNKTLAAQLYTEFKAFFPANAVEYYVSYYDYYQPEAYIPISDTYIEKDLAINEQIDHLRLRAVNALLSGRRDVVIVASVSCIYGMGGPAAMKSSIIAISQDQRIERGVLLRQLVDALYLRNDLDLQRGTFRVKGETIDIFPPYADSIVRVTFWDNAIDSIEELDSTDYHRLAAFTSYQIYPANLFVTTHNQQIEAIQHILSDLADQIQHFRELQQPLYAERIKERVEYDIEMLRELGHCAGIENYSRYFDGRQPGEKPYCLLDFFPKDLLVVIDESHVTIPQLAAMSNGDRARKTNLVQYGFRLPAAFDNRPLRFEEFNSCIHQVIYVSATPADYELQEAEGVVVEQIIRPTGLLDPSIVVRPTKNQIDNLMEEIIERISHHERTLVTTLTKRMAEELTEYLLQHNIHANYIHSDVATLDRVTIMNDLRRGVYDVLVGVNLLREGLDLPEVSLVAILDADKEGFLRSQRSLTQTAGRAARHIHGTVIMYADHVTESMQKTIDETQRRRTIQQQYNADHHITPRPITNKGSISLVVATDSAAPATTVDLSHDPIIAQMTPRQLQQLIHDTTERMTAAAEQLQFLAAAQLRDEILQLQQLLQQRS